MGFYPFLKISLLQNALCLKLFRNMLLFWNSIFRKSSFKCKIRFLDNQVIAKLNLEKKNFLELEFHLNIFKELEFHEFEFFEWNSSSWNSSSTNFFFFNFQFVITTPAPSSHKTPNPCTSFFLVNWLIKYNTKLINITTIVVF